MKVLKFGGTSVGSPERMHRVAELVTQSAEPKIVVLSAVSGTTNTLVQIGKALQTQQTDEANRLITELRQHYNTFCQSLLSEGSAQQEGEAIIAAHFESLSNITSEPFGTDVEKEILAQGELLSTKLFTAYLKSQDTPVILLPALEFMRIDANQEPNEDFIREKLMRLLSQHPNTKLFVTQGYICLNSQNRIDNLQRGGSDYTASLIGAVVGAKEIQIWTDIDGMHNNDPRIADRTFRIDNLSFNEAAELAYFGAKILHPFTVRPAQRANIPVRLLNTMDAQAPGTLISDQQQDRPITAVAAKDGITAIKIKSSRMLLAYGFLRKVFEIFEKYQTPIDLITTSEVGISLTIDNQQYLADIQQELRAFGEVEVDSNHTIVCVVGNMPFQKVGVLKKIVDAIDDIPIRMLSYGGSKFNISLLIDSQFKNETLNRLNEHIFTFPNE
ncbi:aspartate kinase [Tunicatimonas pelagia]|uniref:aspartate kinase n=1 Tax=Tunicatimonas pelagia TaxID=931531 RepID=UPI002665EEF1|nr:aspartate kinase [Tunicatimonas pelagia]WKN42156.1 aspartate kinase [Tunicatimonas pelagia]